MIDGLTDKQEGILRQYKKDVLAWHGYVRFLGLPDLQNNPDVPLDELYVSQSISEQHLTTDIAPNKDLLISPVKFLIDNKKIVILGDPGSGKSTLINWLSWYLSSGLSKKLPQPIGDLIPIPLVLRDLELHNVNDLNSLIAVFHKRPIARAFSQDYNFLFQIIKQGKALLLLDGLDEVSEKSLHIIKEIIQIYKIEYPDNFLIASSRIVGYESSNMPNENIKCEIINGSDIKLDNDNTDSNIVIGYIAPFTNNQISRFSFNWYKEQDNGNSQNAKLLKDEFVEAIAKTESTRQLARTPHLLTMMALIYRIKSDLPDGRALLYDLIAQAYLQSIDTARKIKDAYSWQDKKRWLARVGFEMQSKRDANNNSEKNLLVTKEEVLVWIKLAMAESSNTLIDDEAEKYLDWIARRSGLLLPRGEGQFAFLHLSFQEYFAGIYIQQQIENPEWFEQNDEPDSTLDRRFFKSNIQNLFSDWAKTTTWQQTIILLFESMALKSGWTRRLWNECFPNKIVSIDKTPDDKSNIEAYRRYHKETEVNRLKSALLRNPHTGFTGKFFDNTLKCFLLELLESGKKSNTNNYFKKITISEPISKLLEIKRVLDLKLYLIKEFIEIGDYSFHNISNKTLTIILTKELLSKVKSLELKGCGITQLEFLSKTKNLQSLSIEGGITSLSFAPIWKLKNILSLEVSQPNIEFDVASIEPMLQLQYLCLDFKSIKHSIKLNNFKHLRTLDISYDVGKSFVFSKLNKIKSLKSLTLNAPINSLNGIENFSKLESLHLINSLVEDLSPITSLSNIQNIFLLNSPIQDISILKKVSSLERLTIYHAKVTDFSSLEDTEVYISGSDFDEYKKRNKK
jgi:internalin A